MDSASRHILLCVTGSIAAYKAPEIVRLLQKSGHSVEVLLTDSASEFVGPVTFQALTGKPVLTAGSSGFPHIDAIRRADLLLVAPATAGCMSRMAAGLADDLLGQCYLAAECPVLIAPAMNQAMWKHPAVIRASRQLLDDGVQIVEPDSGELACGEFGAGRLASVESIVSRVGELFEPKQDLTGLKFVVTAGGTSEPIDAVRVITNRSSGKMGVAIANAAARRGASVALIATSSVSGEILANFKMLGPRSGQNLQIDVVESVDEMLATTRSAVAQSDALIMAAAVSDFRPGEPAGEPNATKLKRGDEVLNLTLYPTPDIIGTISEERGSAANPYLVAFAAEVGPDGIARAREKLTRKNVDMIVYNDVSGSDTGFSSDLNDITIISRGGDQVATGVVPKSQAAEALLDQVALAISSR